MQVPEIFFGILIFVTKHGLVWLGWLGSWIWQVRALMRVSDGALLLLHSNEQRGVTEKGGDLICLTAQLLA